MKAVGNYFAAQADIYAQARPRYPDALFAYFNDHVRRAVNDGDTEPWIVDLGAGSGQATMGLTPYFSRILAIDPVPEIIGRCPHHSSIQRIAARAEQLPVADHSVAGVLCAQSAHWFDLPRFHAEMRRVCRKNAILIFVTYGRTRISPDIDTLMDELEHIIGPYWPEGRAHVDSHYAHLPIEFPVIDRPHFDMQLSWSAEAFLAYVASWSSVTAYNNAHRTNCLDQWAPQIIERWPDHQQVNWPLTCLVTSPGYS